ncbi:transporter [Scytonema hofmannii PCC 7110]|uniref:Transporter n=1 Tax=Scytonema hofmannii PCC 7110 TaxID=128403 RepID=A0A139WUQ5_9CYAN|nr:BON domain-containing protein [Scytonema hofmannii]KYC36159.1 transporter [Scytonema hofmannii PCC 7110]
MKKLIPFVFGSLLVFGAAACSPDVSKSSSDAPNNTNEAAQAPAPEATEAALKDAQSQVRRDQLNADIKAREERNNVLNDGKATNRSEDDLESEVRTKLEANIPNGQLTVEAEDNGTVTVAGTVTNQEQLNKIEPLAKEIKGVTTVVNKAKVGQPSS